MAITFQVNLSTVNNYSAKQPYNLTTEGANFPLTRSTWLPNILINNYALKHGDTLVVSGVPALYLLNNYTSGEFKCLDYVSGMAAP